MLRNAILSRSAAFSLAFLVAGAMPAAGQAVVWDNGTPDGGHVEMSGDLSAADDFQVTGGSLSFDTVRFWGFLDPWFSFGPGDIFVEFLVDAGGSPGGLVSSHQVTPDVTYLGLDPLSGLDSYRYDLSLGGFFPNGTYWLALKDLTNPGFSSFWQTSDFFSGNSHQGLNGSYSLFGGELAFQFVDTSSQSVVPEPTTVILLGTGLLGLGVAARRRKRGDRGPEESA